MADETDNNDTDTGAEVQADAGSPQFVTAEQFDAKFTEFQNSMASMLRKMASQKPAAPPKGAPKKQAPKPTPKPTPEQEPAIADRFDDSDQTSSGIEELRAEMAFRESAAEMGLTKKQRETLWKLHQVDQPAKLDDWLAAEAKGLGFIAEPDADATTTTTTETKKEARVNGKPVSDGGSPTASTANSIDPSNILKWGPEERKRYFAENLKNKSDWRDIGNRQAIKAMSQMAQAKLREVAVDTRAKR